MNNPQALLKNVLTNKDSSLPNLLPPHDVWVETFNILTRHNIVLKESLVNYITNNDSSSAIYLFDLYRNGIRIGVLAIHGNKKENSGKITIKGFEELLKGERGNEWNIQQQQDVVKLAKHLNNSTK